MWEENPEYQKAQAKMIGIGLVLLFVAGVVFCVLERDWHLLGELFKFAGALVFCMGLLYGAARLLVRILGQSASTIQDRMRKSAINLIVSMLALTITLAISAETSFWFFASPVCHQSMNYSALKTAVTSSNTASGEIDLMHASKCSVLPWMSRPS
jgi:hypothetical protein